MFSQSIVEQIGYYVYVLKDPRDQKVFYIGKGKNSRIFDHMNAAIETDDETEKLDKIRDIINAGYTIEHYILRHGLTEKESFEIEASLIDFIGMANLSNAQGGHYSNDFGIKTVGEIIAMYEAAELKTDEPMVLININRLYRRDMTEQELYEATRKHWKIGTRREKAKYAVATYGGLTRVIYVIDKWFPVGDRWAFDGHDASDEIRKSLQYKSITSLFPKGAANPIKYINC